MARNGTFETVGRLFCVGFFCVLLAGCDKPAVPKPDGSSGIRGVCLLPGDRPNPVGKDRERNRWVGVEVMVERTNLTSKDPMWGIKYRATADAEGKFELALHPGVYMLFPHDYERLKGMVVSPFIITIEAGRFTEFMLDFDKIKMKDVRDLKP